ncbi:MAG: hypothetical protein O2907_11020 [Proteobacteria bacterium]|nr:hypothetical protein [Pseudomonadota bacterium]
MNNRVNSFVILAAAFVAAWPAAALSHETDQFSNRSDSIADSTKVLNGKVNEAIIEIVEKTYKNDERMAVVNAMYGEIGGRFLVDRIEKWANESPEVEKLKTGRYDSIYSVHPFWATRVTTLFGVGRTMRVNNQLIGTDKLGHFVSQGRKYYRRFLRYDAEAKAAKQSARAERAVFGQMTNGNFSNADLVANYEGHRFFRSLFEDDIVPGKPAILRWEGNRWIIQREFDWADHVNEYWDEALNVNHFDALLYGHMYQQFVSFCPRYWRDPSLYTIVDESRFQDRYSHLGLKDNSVLRLDSLCPVQAFLKAGTLLANTFEAEEE